MDGLLTVVILFFVSSLVIKLFRTAAQKATKSQQQTQAQTEATKPRPAARPAPQREDFRFPSAKPKPAPQPVLQEGRDPSAVMGEYTPIAPSVELQSQFTEYKGSLEPASTEGVGYQSEDYEPVAVPYRTGLNAGVKVLPESFGRDTLLQAVVMSEVLKRPGARR